MSPATQPLADPGKAHGELAEMLDWLALDVIVQGSQAITADVLTRLADAATLAGIVPLASQAAALRARLVSSPLSAGEANAFIDAAQALLAAGPIEASEGVVPAAPPPPEGPSAVSDPGARALLFKDDPELVSDFIMESSEHLTDIDEKILELEKDSSRIDLLHAVFRGFHSIKGLAGFLELREIQAVAHEVETLLDHARNLRVTITPAFVDLVLEASEYLKGEVALVQAQLSQAPLPAVRPNAPLLHSLSLANAALAPDAGPSAAEQLRDIDRMLSAGASTRPAAPAPAAPPETPDAAPAAPAPATTTALIALTAPEPVPTVRQSDRAAEPANSSIRVETSKLDRLMDMVGEMVIAQSIFSNGTKRANQADARLASELSQLARITAEVQRCAMSMRMMPIGPLFQKNAKMVRDLSRKNGKQVHLELAGESTELDKTIAEELADPLLHMIRNALDHGIEPPAERIAAGKPPTASLRIAAEHQAGQIVISISDDGRGLSSERILKKAVENGLVDPAAQLSEDEIFNLIFAPGFSTAEKITDISGRGVGMDVVRQHVQTLRGRIAIESTFGRGTTFSIFLPLTLAIIEGLVIVVGDHRYIVPLFSVREMFRPTPDMLFSVQGKGEMILLRGTLLPILRLHRRFSIEPRHHDICSGLLVVCSFANKFFCLFVDSLLGRQEVVVKSLDEAFRNVQGLTGSAILGDGRIGLILDVGGIFQSAPSAPSAAKGAVASMTSALSSKAGPEPLSARDFDRIRKLAYSYCGLSIDPGKEDLVASRLGRIMRNLGISTFGAYFDFVMADKSEQALVSMIDSLTTNHTGFFREPQHFDFLTSTVFPALRDRAQVDIWSAACSTGEEPYSLAFHARDFFGDRGPRIRILATDISTRVLETAKKGTYEAARFDNLSVGNLSRHLLRGQGAASHLYRVKPAVRELIEFRRVNLIKPFSSVSTVFPLILCRNVMIYFDAATQEDLIERFFQQLEPGGYLFIGHSESLTRISDRLDYVQPAIYRKPGGAAHPLREEHPA